MPSIPSFPRAERIRTGDILALGVASCLALAVLVLVLWGLYSEPLSDHVAYTLVRHGQTRGQVERALPRWGGRGWSARVLYADASQPRTSEYYTEMSKRYAGYRVVRYRWWADIFVDVFYDGRGRVFRTNCNG